MSRNVITVKEALALIKDNKYNDSYSIDFSTEGINVIDAVELGTAGIDVPEELIVYDDDNLDFSDIPELSDEELKRLKRETPAVLSLNREFSDWAEKEKINIGELAAELLHDFYNKVKKLRNKAAF